MRRAQRKDGRADTALESRVDEKAQDEEIGGKGESPGRHGLTCTRLVMRRSKHREKGKHLASYDRLRLHKSADAFKVCRGMEDS